MRAANGESSRGYNSNRTQEEGMIRFAVAPLVLFSLSAGMAPVPNTG